MVKSWLVQDQTVLGKDYSNLLIADSLLKTIWFINAPCYGNEALASPKANGIWLQRSVQFGTHTMLLALEGRNKTGFIDNTCRRSHTDEVLGRQWDRVNAVVLIWILNSISEELFLGQIFSKRAFKVWNKLKETFDRVDGFVTLNLHHKINSLTQNGAPVAEYFNKLMRLDDSYMQLRSNILFRDPLPDAKGAYVLISSEEGGAQRSQTFGNTSRHNNVPRPNNNENIKAVSGPTLVCEHYGFNGHNIDRCFKLIGIKVSHPNGTEALITKVGYLVLTDFLTLYDVLVVPEYYVTLVSVHKVARDSKFIVGFAESKCFLMSHDLMDVTIIRIGKQVGGLYYFDSIRGLFGSDNGTEFVNHKFSAFCENNGIIHQTFCAYTPQHNGIVKRKHRHLLNRLPSSVLKGKSLYQLVFNKKPSLNHLRVFGCRCFATILSNHDKFGSRAEKCVLVVYSSFKKGYKLAPDTPNDDNNVNAQAQNEGGNSSQSGSPTIDLFEDDVGHPQGSNGSARENEMTATSEHDFALSEGGDVNIPDTEHVQIVVNQPLRRKAIGGKWVFKLKYKSDGEIEIYKARIVAKGFNQNEGVDFDETFSPVVKIVTVRPDIAYSIHCLSQFMHKPLKSHLKIALKVLRHLNGYLGKGIHISKNISTYLEVFVNADWAKCVVTKKSVTGFCIFLNGSLVSWKSKKQKTLSKSSVEAEYRAIASTTS
ncbi:ribonuclease H-like domain-containing protein [Tanacetum coccineum]